ncbi:MAG: ABC transporter substrate-binding protein [Alphaproteobacteria bacterium]|nr:ABC transporter substrate-binding protein [Alphaproteobacteria bacterium]MDE2111641.1 ABC transporter substrate-binding protein [Alphaproteobacteria bacterium]MDE2494249.1 ABC transporter substrate-binding protein [Alphaproteobacteria bacterium]
MLATNVTTKKAELVLRMDFPLKVASQLGAADYRNNMHPAHGWIVTILCVLYILAQPVFAAPQRVVSTFLCTDEYVFRMVPRERIAALSYEATDRHPVVSTIADRAKGIRTIHPSTETVLALHPDLVVMYAGTNPRLHDNLRKLSIPILDLPWANSLADIRSITTMLGEKLGAPETAKAMLADMDRKIDAARAGAPRPPVRGILYEPNGYASVGSITSEIMAISGIADVAPKDELTRQGTLPVEAVIAAAPDLLILGGEARIGSARAYTILHHPALRALKGRTVMEFAGMTPLLCPGPWSLDAAKTFGDLARKARALARKRARH